ncbi:hypothetical protein BRC2024_KCUCJSVR_CDS_0174 [Acinetobacter phage vB_AbaM_KissB]
MFRSLLRRWTANAVVFRLHLLSPNILRQFRYRRSWDLLV